MNESKMGGESSYTELLTCLEMARDVRAMRLDQEGLAPQGAASGAISGPAGGGGSRGTDDLIAEEDFADCRVDGT